MVVVFQFTWIVVVSLRNPLICVISFVIIILIQMRFLMINSPLFYCNFLLDSFQRFKGHFDVILHFSVILSNISLRNCHHFNLLIESIHIRPSLIQKHEFVVDLVLMLLLFLHESRHLIFKFSSIFFDRIFERSTFCLHPQYLALYISANLQKLVIYQHEDFFFGYSLICFRFLLVFHTILHFFLDVFNFTHCNESR